tara:strand:+ start:2260 stop:2547 length:288 start_codon:yes stop_codon:yes gene_type:complete
MKRTKPINQHLLVIGKYHGATNTQPCGRISFRTGIPNSKRKLKNYDHRFNNIEDQVAYHLKDIAKPVCQVQMPDNSEVGLLYPWKAEIINKIGLK